MNKPSESKTRDRNKPLKVYVSSDERLKIMDLATSCRLSPSAYLRIIGLGCQPKSAFDRESIRELAKVNADQGRLGGLLKLWLSERKGEGAPVGNVRSVLQQIENLQTVIAKLIMEEARHL